MNARAKTGSWFIQELCRNINLYSYSEDVINIMTRTIRSVNKRSKDANKVFIYKQIPCFVSTLQKKFFLTNNRQTVSVNSETLENYVTQNQKLKSALDYMKKEAVKKKVIHHHNVIFPNYLSESLEMISKLVRNVQTPQLVYIIFAVVVIIWAVALYSLLCAESSSWL